MSRVIELQQPFQQKTMDAASAVTDGLNSVVERLTKNPVADFTAKKVEDATKAVKSVSSQFSPANVEYDVIGGSNAKTLVAPGVQSNTAPPAPPQSSRALSFSKTDGTMPSPAETSRSARTPIVSVEIATPKFVNINEPTDVKINLRNAGSQSVQRTYFTITMPEDAELVSAEPAAMSKENGLSLIHI